jgi:hypothetical protein
MKLTKQNLREIAWSRGDLKYKLYRYQHILYDTLYKALNDPKCLKYALNCSRRWGKSTVLSLIAIETALRTPNSQVRFAAPTAKALKKITHPIFRMLIDDAPEPYKPEYKSQDQVWQFYNGSEIHMAGTDNGNYESLRGTASNLNLIDEAAFADELDYILRSILMPQTLTTGGKTLLASTPPKTPAHDFVGIYQECEREGYTQKFTIFDNPTLSPETIALYAKEAGGFNSTTWKREYLGEFVVDEALSIIPEWKDDFIGELPKDDYNAYYHRYVGMDLGVKDFTALIFGYYDFRQTKLFIEDELTMNGPKLTTISLKNELVLTERKLWGDKKPYRRISDNNNLMLIQDLGMLHDLYFIPTSKDTLEAMINEVRMFVHEGRLVVHPKCKQLIGCLKYGIWDEKHKMFSRSSTYGHFDHLAALVYLIRNLDKNTNPIPATHNLAMSTHYISPDMEKNTNKNLNTLKDLFTAKRK